MHIYIYVYFYVDFTHYLELKYCKEWDLTLENFQVYILMVNFLYVQPDDG